MLDQVSSSPSTRTLPAWREPWAAAALRLVTLTRLCSLCSVERRRSESSQWGAEQAGAAQSPTAAESGSGRRRRCMRSRDRARALCREPCACNAACASARRAAFVGTCTAAQPCRAGGSSTPCSGANAVVLDSVNDVLYSPRGSDRGSRTLRPKVLYVCDFLVSK